MSTVNTPTPPRAQPPAAAFCLRAARWALVALVASLLPAPEAGALQIRNLKEPQSFLAPPSGGSYFISNINGGPTAKDNNGFITRLDREGKQIDLEFIRGGRGRTVLHAPKGMAIAGDTLYVADIDTVRGFDVATGHPSVDITIPGQPEGTPTTGLVDVVYDGQGLLYVSDVETNAIYRITPTDDHAVSLLVRDEVLAGPRGLAIHPRTGHLIAVSWNQGSILDIAPTGKVTVLVSNSFFSWRFTNLDGVDFDTWGSMYVSDITAGKVWRVTPDEDFKVIAEYLPAPAGISVDRTNHVILVPYLYSNAAEINGLEAPVQANRKKKRRTLEDYGFPFMKRRGEDKAEEHE